MPLTRRRLRILLIAGAGVLAALVGLVLAATGAVADLEEASVDQRFQNRGTHAVPDDIVVVGIDDETLGALPDERPPYRRSLHAAAIRALTEAGARVIVYDLQFSEPTASRAAAPAVVAAGDAEDFALIDAIAASGRVVLGTAEVLTDDPSEPQPNVLPDYVDAAAAVGVANYPDGPFRRRRLAAAGSPTLAAAAAGLAGARFDDGDVPPEGARVDYHGPLGTIPQIPFARVTSGDLDRGAVDGKIVIVGNTSATLGDVHRTPFEGFEISGPEINANAISTLIRDIPLRDTPDWLDALALVALTALATLAALWRRAVLGALAAAALIVVWLVVAQAAFNAGWVVDVVAPAIAVALAGLAGLAINYWLVARDRVRLRTEFARFLPPPVVDAVIEEAGEDGRLGGRRMYATVLFADLRGFTAVAERMPPELVIETLNTYLGGMSDAVLDHGGTLVAYQGDGLMAVFGAPLERVDHADRAVAAAREMRDVRLPAFNDWARANGVADAFRMGIGVASGPVMSGNVGSERRLEYAAVGDTTNAAARLEGLTKETPHMLLIADTTRAALTRAVADLAAVGALGVRGREVPASVWTLGSANDTGPADAGPVDSGR